MFQCGVGFRSSTQPTLRLSRSTNQATSSSNLTPSRQHTPARHCGGTRGICYADHSSHGSKPPLRPVRGLLPYSHPHWEAKRDIDTNTRHATTACRSDQSAYPHGPCRHGCGVEGERKTRSHASSTLAHRTAASAVGRVLRGVSAGPDAGDRGAQTNGRSWRAALPVPPLRVRSAPRENAGGSTRTVAPATRATPGVARETGVPTGVAVPRRHESPGRGRPRVPGRGCRAGWRGVWEPRP